MARWGPYFFSRRRRYREERLLAYIHREHGKGRHLTEVLEDPYVERCGSREFVWVTLRDTPLIELLSAVVRADPAELGDERAQRGAAAEQRRDPDRVRRELVELRVQLALAAVPPEVAPLVGAPRSNQPTSR